jgi:hypothetical protein
LLRREAPCAIVEAARTGADPYLAIAATRCFSVLAIGRGDLVRATDHLASSANPRASKRTEGNTTPFALLFSRA